MSEWVLTTCGWTKRLLVTWLTMVNFHMVNRTVSNLKTVVDCHKRHYNCNIKFSQSLIFIPLVCF